MNETIEEIFGYAPKDATHYSQNNQMYYKFIGDAGLFWDDSRSEWLLASSRNNYTAMIERPTVKPWSGPEDGLPPVNKQVMFKVKGLHQGYGFVSFYGQEFCVIRNTTQDGGPTEQVCKISEFTVVTPEQLASEKRESAIREFMDVVGIDCRVTASKAVDAGFKREVV